MVLLHMFTWLLIHQGLLPSDYYPYDLCCNWQFELRWMVARCAMYDEYCTSNSVLRRTLYVQCTMVHCSTFNVCCTIHKVLCVIVHCTLLNVQCTVYSTPYTMYNVHYIVYTLYFRKVWMEGLWWRLSSSMVWWNDEIQMERGGECSELSGNKAIDD